MKLRSRTAAVAAAAAVTMCAMAWGQAPAGRSVWDGVYTKEQAARGQGLYSQNCASCHGEMLEGIEMAPALAGGDFIDSWTGQSLGDLFERIRATMPRDKPGRLSREVNADITAWILSVNKFPAGAAELAHDTQVLQQIRIVPAKP